MKIMKITKMLFTLMIVVMLLVVGCSKGKIKDDKTACTLDYSPVCGVDGKTYSNKCNAKDVAISYDGECKKTETDIQEEYSNAKPPKDCVTWFDGCNTCMVSDDGTLGCTKMACKTLNQPTCLQYKKDLPPKDCIAWFDGCNTCSVVDGKADACTLMYCETPTEPKCLEFKK